MVAPGEQRRPGRRAHRRHMEGVVRQAHLFDPLQRRRADLAAVRLRATEPGVVDKDEEHIGRVFGRLRAGDEAPVRNRLVHRAGDRPAEGLVGDRQHGAVGLNLPRASFRAALRPLAPPSSITATDLAGESANACSAVRRSPSSTMARIAAWPGLRFCPSPPSRLPTILFLANLPTSAPAAAPTAVAASSGGAKRPDQQADAATPFGPLAPHVVAGLAHDDLALLVFLNEDHTIALDLLLLHQLRELVEVLFGRLVSHVSGHDDDVFLFFTHFDAPFDRWSPYVAPTGRRLSRAG